LQQAREDAVVAVEARAAEVAVVEAKAAEVAGVRAAEAAAAPMVADAELAVVAVAVVEAVEAAPDHAGYGLHSAGFPPARVRSPAIKLSDVAWEPSAQTAEATGKDD
jgi:hypothetical protein